MQNSIDVKLSLKIFNAVLTHGKKLQECHEYQGFKAWSDFDGYNCFLKYRDVTMTLMFHGKYAVDYPDSDALDAFEKKLLAFKL